MPALTTAHLLGGARRSASRSGQPRKALLVEVRAFGDGVAQRHDGPVAVAASTSTWVTSAGRRMIFCCGSCAAPVWSPARPRHTDQRRGRCAARAGHMDGDHQLVQRLDFRSMGSVSTGALAGRITAAAVEGHGMVAAGDDGAIGPAMPTWTCAQRQGVAAAFVGEAQADAVAGHRHPHQLADGDVAESVPWSDHRHIAGIFQQQAARAR